MENTPSSFIESVLSEASLDSRVCDGIVNLKNPTHAIVVAEKMFYAGASLEIIEEFAKTYIAANEGKYPERQAYNKEGWLVTFPSAEYKNAAIKKGTHFASDPTHGKGGMNVYYKRKGKQKRMGQQDPSQVEPSQASQPSAPAAPQEPGQAPQQKAPEENPTDASGAAPQVGGDSGGAAPVIPTEPEGGADAGGDSSLPSSDAGGDATPKGGNAAPKPEAPSAPAAPAAPAAPSFVNISIEFAKSKQWNPTPFGEWRNLTGDATAIVALSGEVVPIKTTDREELKLFAAKRQP